MRICLITTEYPPAIGGMGQAVRRIARGLCAFTTHEVHVLWFDNPWGLTEPLSSGLPILDPPRGRTPVVHRWELTLQEQDVPSQAIHTHLRNLHGTVGFDAFVAFGASYSGFPVVLLGKELAVPTFVSMHGADINLDVFRSDRFPHIHWALANATAIVSVSEAELRIAQALGKAGECGCVIANYIEPTDFEQGVTAAVPLDPSSTIVAMAASFAQAKGLHVLLEAAESVVGLQLTLVLIGDARSWEHEYVEAQKRLHGDRVSIVWTGIVPHRRMLSYLHLADIFVLPSLSEGAPNVLLEAMLARRAIVASDVGAVRDVIDDGVNGLIVRPGSVDELAEAVTRLGNDKALRRRLARAAYQTVISQFAPEKEAAAWDVVLRSVESGRHEGGAL